MHLQEKPLACALCPKRYARGSSLHRHEREMHGPTSPPPKRVAAPHARLKRAQTGAFTCDGCSKRFVTRKALQVHARSKHDTAVPKPFACKFCDKTFLYASFARNHEAQHTGETVMACRVCAVRFKTSEARHEHEAAEHANILPYTCNTCARLCTHPRRCTECGGGVRRTIISLLPKNLLQDATLFNVLEIAF